MEISTQSQGLLPSFANQVFVQERPRFFANDPRVVSDAISLQKDDFIKKYMLLNSGVNIGLLTIAFNKINLGVSSKHKPEPKLLSKDEARFIKAIVEITSPKELAKTVNQILWLDLVEEEAKFSIHELNVIVKNLAKDNLINILDEKRFSLTDLGVISFESRKNLVEAKKKAKKVDLINFKPRVTTSGRGHYVDLITAFKPGDLVKFRVPKREELIEGIVVESYYRKNSKALGIYEQVVIKARNEIFYKTANVLAKHNE